MLDSSTSTTSARMYKVYYKDSTASVPAYTENLANKESWQNLETAYVISGDMKAQPADSSPLCAGLQPLAVPSVRSERPAKLIFGTKGEMTHVPSCN